MAFRELIQDFLECRLGIRNPCKRYRPCQRRAVILDMLLHLRGQLRGRLGIHPPLVNEGPRQDAEMIADNKGGGSRRDRDSLEDFLDDEV